MTDSVGTKFANSNERKRCESKSKREQVQVVRKKLFSPVLSREEGKKIRWRDRAGEEKLNQLTSQPASCRIKLFSPGSHYSHSYLAAASLYRFNQHCFVWGREKDERNFRSKEEKYWTHCLLIYYRYCSIYDHAYTYLVEVRSKSFLNLITEATKIKLMPRQWSFAIV